MSRILDALKRRPRTAERTSTRRSGQTDAVLATLGYAQRRSWFAGSYEIGRFVLYSISILIVGLVAWGSYIWATSPVPGRGQRVEQQRRGTVGPVGPTTTGVLRTLPISASRDPAVAPFVQSRPVSEALTASGPAAVFLPEVIPPPSTDSATVTRPSRVPRQPANAVTPGGTGRRTVAAGNIPPPPPLLSVRSNRIDIPDAVPAVPPMSPPNAAVRSPSAGVPAAMPVDHFRLALYYHRAGDFENALLHYRALLEHNELNAEAHNNLGLLYQEKGLIDDAVKQYQRALSIDQRYVKAHNNLGVLWLRAGKIDAAAAEFRAALAADPKNVESMTNLAVVNRQTGHADEARDLLQRALTLDARHAASHYNLALIAEDRGDLQDAMRHYRSFLENSSSDQATLAGEVRSRLALLTMQLGKTGQKE